MPANTSISTILNKIEQKTKSVRENDYNQKQVLYVLLNILKDANDWSLNKIERAMKYLNNLKVIDINWKKQQTTRMLGEIIAEKNNIPTDTTVLANRTNPNAAYIPANEKTFYIELFLALQQLRGNKIAWEYQYPLNENNQINHEEIPIWQRGRQKLKDVSAYVDFRRGCKILGKDLAAIDADDQEEADMAFKKLIDELLAQTTDNETDKNAFRQWLYHNGGQENAMIMMELLLIGEFTKGLPFESGKSKMQDFNWEVVNGKIQLSFTAQYFTLAENVEQMVSADNSTQLIRDKYYLWLDFDGKSHRTKISDERLQDILAKKMVDDIENKAPPLLRVKSTLVLDIDESKTVSPRITNLTVTSLTRSLHTPALNYSPAQHRRF